MNYIIFMVVLVALFVLEGRFPHHIFERGKGKHALLNIAFDVINIGVVTVFYLVMAQRYPTSAGIFAGMPLHPVVVSVILFLMFDAWMYLWHRLNHEVPFLWRFHRMHHTDMSMDVTTALRFHPGEIFMSLIFNIGIFFILGITAPVLMVYNLAQNTCVLFHHSNVAVPPALDKKLKTIIVTPDMHRVHHSEIRHETDSNYASLFSFWDRLFKTFRVREDTHDIVFGIQGLKSAKWFGFFGMLKTPFF